MIAAYVAFAIALAGKDDPEVLLDRACFESAKSIEQIFSGPEDFVADDFITDYAAWPESVRKPRAELPPLTQLIRLGAAAIPTLLSNLTSRAPTSYSESDSVWSIFVISDAYDPRYRRSVSGTWDSNWEFYRPRYPDKYAFRKGDLAFLALGQILNRHYCEQSFDMHKRWFSTTVDSPELLLQVQRDWFDATEETLKETLTADVLMPDSDQRQKKAFARYRTYFPEDAKQLALTVLQTLERGDHSIKVSFWLIREFQPLDSAELHDATYRLLLGDLSILGDGEGAVRLTLLNNLRVRPEYLERALDYARRQVLLTQNQRYKEFVEKFGG